MLLDCGFAPTVCRSSVEAIQRLSTPAEPQMDILLIDASCLAKKTSENTALLFWAKTLPLVLMASSSTSTTEMVNSITKQGAGQ